MLVFSHPVNNVNQSNEVFECRAPAIDCFKKKSYLFPVRGLFLMHQQHVNFNQCLKSLVILGSSLSRYTWVTLIPKGS